MHEGRIWQLNVKEKPTGKANSKLKAEEGKRCPQTRDQERKKEDMGLELSGSCVFCEWTNEDSQL